MPRSAERYGSAAALQALLAALRPEAHLAPPAAQPESLRSDFDPAPRQQRQIEEIDDHNQWLLRESPYVRADFMARLDTSSPEKYQASVEDYRRIFREDVIGRFDRPLLPPQPRSRKSYDGERWTGYEVVLDVFPDVFAYGILCVPKGIAAGEKRPVVVCQHGLEGRPQDIVTGDHSAYHDFASRLAERGFVTFAPQNIYIFQDRFRTLQRKANPLKKTLFSLHGAPAPADRQLVEVVADRGRLPDRFLRSLVRRQERDENSGPGHRLLPVDLFRRLQ